MKLGEMTVDVNAIDNGVWVEDFEGLDNVRLKVRGTSSPEFQRALQREILRLPKRERHRPDSVKFEEMRKRLVGQICWMDWEGVEGEDGAPVEFTKDLANEIMTDRRYMILSDAVMVAVGRVDSGLTETIEEQEKN